MHLKKIIYFNKNKKRLKLNQLYIELLKTKHLLSFFLANLKKKQLFFLYKIISKKNKIKSFLIKLENRLDFLLIKSNLVLNGKHVKQLISHGHVLVNKKVVLIPNFQIKKFDLISLNKERLDFLKQELIDNIFKTSSFNLFLFHNKKIMKKLAVNNTIIYSKFPANLEINFRIFNLIIFREFQFNEFFLPKIISLYDYNQLYFIL